MAVASMVLGIVALVFTIFGAAPVGVITGIVGIALAAIAKKNAPSGMATAGLVMSIIAVSLALVFWIACAACAAGAEDFLDSLL